MKLYGYLLLLALVLCTSAISRQDFERYLILSEDSDEIADERREQHHDTSLEALLDMRRASNNEDVKTPLLNLTVIQRGAYAATVKINFLRNGTQDEYETGSVLYGTNKVFFLQKDPSDVITYVRIRFHVVASFSLFGDFQVRDPSNQRLCFVLSGTAFTPVYSICAPDQDYSRK